MLKTKFDVWEDFGALKDRLGIVAGLMSMVPGGCIFESALVLCIRGRVCKTILAFVLSALIGNFSLGKGGKNQPEQDNVRSVHGY